MTTVVNPGVGPATGTPVSPALAPAMAPAMVLALEAHFGTVARWRQEFLALAKAHAGAGQLLLLYQPHAGTLVNQWVAGPVPALAAAAPLLVLDLDKLGPGGRQGDDVAAGASPQAWMDTIDWASVYMRYQQAVQAASEPFGVSLDEVGDALLLDVRRAAVYDQARSTLARARWRDPATVSTWAAELPAGRGCVVYCVYGHEVSRATAMQLRGAGVNAHFLRGGIDAWQAAGRPVADKPGAAER